MSVKLFIGGLSWNTDDQSLRSEFEKFGAVSDAVVIRERETNRSRGFGFVTYEAEEAADAAISAMDNQVFDGRSIRVSRAQERQEGERRPFNGGNRRPFGGDRERRPFYGERRSDEF
jgi:RNA recognition motif-containing protein